MFQIHQELPSDLRLYTAHAMRAVLSNDVHFEILTAAAGYVYTRKSEQCVDLFGQPRNDSYGRPDDHIVLSLALRIENRPPLAAVEKLRTVALSLTTAKLDAEISAAENTAANALERVQHLKAQRNLTV